MTLRPTFLGHHQKKAREANKSMSAIGKLMGSIRSDALCRYLVKNKLISDHQFGFLPHRSATTQLIYIVDRWLKAIERKSGTAAVFMDFTKAFDKVWHSGLLFKLATLGVQKDSIEWIKDYLSCRYISVRVGSTLSDPHGISAGVPQGSH